MSSRALITALAAGALLAWPLGCADFERGEDEPTQAPLPDVSPPFSLDTGGGGNTDAGGGEDVVDDTPVGGLFSFATDVYPILEAKCGQCHSSGGPRGLLLTGDAATDYEPTLKLVNIADPPASKLLMKGTGETQHGGGGTLNPASADYQAILDWIVDGAFP